MRDSNSDVFFAVRPGSSLLVWVLVPASILRAVMLQQTPDSLASDPDLYRGIALQLSEEGVFARPNETHPTAYRPPLYPLLLAGIVRAGGGVRTLAAVHLLLGLLTVALTACAGFWLSRRNDTRILSSSESHTPLVDHRADISATIAAVLVAIDPLLVQNTGLVMTETLAAFLVSGLLCLIARRVKLTRYWMALGIVFGLCGLCRPTFGAFCGLAAVVWCARQFLARPNAAPLDSRLSTLNSQPTLDPPSSSLHPRRLALCVVLGTAITVAPWAIRNWIVFGRPIVTTTHGGYTLLLGHNPVYYREVVDQPWGTVWPGESLTAWQASLETALRADGVPPFDEVARDRWMYRQAWRNIADDPGMTVRAGFTLLGRFWGVMPMNTQERSLPTVLRWGIGVFYIAVFVAMGLGLWRLTRAEWSRWWPLVALIVSFTCVHSLYWADMRMRAPIVPAIALLAARGLSAKGQGSNVEGRG